MKHLPLLIDCHQRSVLVIGGGPVAARKAQLILRAGARLTVVTEHPQPAMQQLIDQHQLPIQQRRFTEADVHGGLLKDFFLVCSAFADTDLNNKIAVYCRAHGILFNHSGDHQQGDVVMPATRRRGPITVMVSIDTGLPAMSRQLVNYVSASLPDAYCQLSELALAMRPLAAQRYPDMHQRRLLWHHILYGAAAQQAFAGDLEAAKREIERLLDDEKLLQRLPGEVYLVGAGPGDPELLTVKALRLIQQSEVVVYDRLVSNEIMALLPDGVEKIYAGKARSKHTLPQPDINRLLVELAHSGKRVLRLKGGDPLTFGRGGEEVQSLLAERVPFQLIPGITAASGCAAYAGIPLTHRDYAHACIFVAGYLRDGSVNLDWDMLARPQQTVVFYMGSQVLATICEQLIQHGMPADTPAAFISHGTLPQQRVVAASLASLPDAVKRARISPPTLIIVGEVVKMHAVLRWYRKEHDVWHK